MCTVTTVVGVNVACEMVMVHRRKLIDCLVLKLICLCAYKRAWRLICVSFKQSTAV